MGLKRKLNKGRPEQGVHHVKFAKRHSREWDKNICVWDLNKTKTPKKLPQPSSPVMTNISAVSMPSYSYSSLLQPTPPGGNNNLWQQLQMIHQTLPQTPPHNPTTAQTQPPPQQHQQLQTDPSNNYHQLQQQQQLLGSSVPQQLCVQSRQALPRAPQTPKPRLHFVSLNPEPLANKKELLGGAEVGRHVQLVVKNSPIFVVLEAPPAVKQLCLSGVYSLCVNLVYDFDSEENVQALPTKSLREVGYVKEKPVEFSLCTNSDEQPILVVQLKVKTLSSQHEDMLFRLFFSVEDSNHFQVAGLTAISSPIKVVSKAHRKSNKAQRASFVPITHELPDAVLTPVELSLPALQLPQKEANPPTMPTVSLEARVPLASPPSPPLLPQELHSSPFEEASSLFSSENSTSPYQPQEGLEVDRLFEDEFDQKLDWLVKTYESLSEQEREARLSKMDFFYFTSALLNDIKAAPPLHISRTLSF